MHNINNSAPAARDLITGYPPSVETRTMSDSIRSDSSAHGRLERRLFDFETRQARASIDIAIDSNIFDIKRKITTVIYELSRVCWRWQTDGGWW